MGKIPKHIKIVITILLIAFIYKSVDRLVSPGIELFNQTKTIELQYDAVVQQQVSNYDGYYLAFKDKQTNADVNKETFITVTNIIMSNRKDGPNVAWKWMQENQNIPYSEFTKFYAELSSFITERYADNMKIETQKQSVVQQHNTLLSTFPNNLYNKYLHIQPLKYTFGFLSQETKDKFGQKE